MWRTRSSRIWIDGRSGLIWVTSTGWKADGGKWRSTFDPQQSLLLQVWVMVVTLETATPLYGCFRHSAELPGPVPPYPPNNYPRPVPYRNGCPQYFLPPSYGLISPALPLAYDTPSPKCNRHVYNDNIMDITLNPVSCHSMAAWTVSVPPALQLIWLYTKVKCKASRQES